MCVLLQDSENKKLFISFVNVLFGTTHVQGAIYHTAVTDAILLYSHIYNLLHLNVFHRIPDFVNFHPLIDPWNDKHAVPLRRLYVNVLFYDLPSSTLVKWVTMSSSARWIDIHM